MKDNKYPGVGTYRPKPSKKSKIKGKIKYSMRKKLLSKCINNFFFILNFKEAEKYSRNKPGPG